MMQFELSEKEKKTLKNWKDKIKDLHGEYGIYTYKFTPTGIGISIKVYSHLAKIEINLTDMNNW